MPGRSVFTVGPASGPSKEWEVSAGAGRGHRFPRKDDAVRWAREQAKQAKPSQLRVKGANGRIQTEYTYGGDPRRYKG
jgi:hypothetical protein